MLMQIFFFFGGGEQKKSIMVCYGIFWSGQLDLFYVFGGSLIC